MLRTYIEHKKISSNVDYMAKHHSRLQDKETINAQDQEYVENYQFSNGAKYTGRIIT